jgi:1-acyl-sn-glycerol-3-phosphate acyltransferase
MVVEGLDLVPATGPLLIVPNHDSQMDPIVVGVALRSRRRLRFLARANLWTIPVAGPLFLGPVLNGLGQIPIRRGSGDSGALDLAKQRLCAGDALGVFPEGRLTWGVPIRARTGVGLLATWCPEARIVLCAIEGSTDFVRFPTRPRLRLRFFLPTAGQAQAGEDPNALAVRLLADLRAIVPPTPAGRARIIGGPPRIQRLLARNQPD